MILFLNIVEVPEGFFVPQGLIKILITVVVTWGHGGALVESIAFNRRVVGSTPAVAVT